MPPTSQRRPSGTSARAPKHIMPTNSHTSAGSGNGNVDPQSWLNFSLPPRRVPGSNQPGAPTGLPRRSRRGEGWRGGAMSRERYVHANFRFVLKPNETLSYGAHFADPDISLHWPHILQILVPTFSAFSVAQGYVSSDPARIHSRHPIEEIDDVASSIDETELMSMGEDAARMRQRMEEEKRGRMCPICLGKPVAGRMTKCGHIFCFPCVLHYIRLSEVPGSARCPICGDTIHEGMLKSVKYLDPNDMIRSAKGESEDEPDTSSDPSTSTGLPAYTGNADGGSIIGDLDGFGLDGAPTSDPVGESSTTGHKIYMRLLQRPQMTTLALPSSPTWPSDAVPPHTAPFNFLPDVQSYSRYVLATPEYMLSELQRELGELRREHELLKGDDLGREFVRAARDKVERQAEKVRNELMIPMVEREAERVREAWAEVVGGERKERQRKREREKREAERAALAAAQQEQALASRLAGDAPAFIPGGTPADGAPAYLPGQDGYIIPPNRPVEPNPMPSPTANKRNRRKPQIIAGPSTPPAGPSYHFYQSTLGANVFLHPLDIRILLSHYQSYSLFPSLISFTSPGFDPDTITDDLRKRAKYLSHLPLGTEVVFVEADLEPLVGAASLIPFEQALKARKQKRRSRVMKEDKAKVKAEKAERERHNHVSAEERDYLSAVARSAIGNTMHGGEGIASVHSLPLSAGMDSAGYLGSSVGSSTGAGGLGTSPTSSWGPNRSFAGALHSSARPTVYRPASARTAREPREGTGDDDYDPELDAQLAWDAAFEHLELQDARGGIRETSRGGVGGAGGGRGKGHRGEEDAAVLGSAQTGGDGAGAGAGGKKGKKGARKVLVLGGGGGRRA